MPDIRHIVFDIGSVLIHYDPNLPYRRLIPDDAKRQWFFDNVCTHDWNIEQDAGRSWKTRKRKPSAGTPNMLKTFVVSAVTGTRWCRTPMTIALRSWKA
jgi:2-haloacid dehalogenase